MFCSSPMGCLVTLLMCRRCYRHKVTGSAKAGWFSAIPLFDMIDKETGGDYKN